MGLFGGFLGWDADDERLPDYQKAVDEAGIEITIEIHPIGAEHPNTYQITLYNDDESHSMIALSTGGGMIQVIAIDSSFVNMDGDFYTISKPTLVVPSPQGIGLINALFSVDPQIDVQFAKSHVMVIAPTFDKLQQYYIQATTGIQTVEKGGIVI